MDLKSGFTQQESKPYTANEGPVSWYDARKKCLTSGGDLASITNLRTTDVGLYLTRNQKYWIGLHRNKWIWNSTGDRSRSTLELSVAWVLVMNMNHVL